MARTNDLLDEVIRVEAVADWCRAAGDAEACCSRVAEAEGEGWNARSDDERLDAIASAHPAADSIDDAMHGVHRTVATASWIGIAVAAGFGVVAVAAALPANREAPTNVFWLLAGVLGLQSVLLLGWMAATAAAPRWRTGGAAAWFVGRLARAMADRGARGRERSLRSSSETATPVPAMRHVVRRRGRVETRTPLARWGFGVLTNSMWTAFNLAGLATALVLLGSRQYEFAWESTILGPDRYIAIIDAVAWLPRRLGFAAPDAASIAASRFDPTAPDAFPPQSDELRAAWSGLLIGAIVAFGLLPRATLVAICLWRRAAARRRLAVDTGDPAVAALLETARRTVFSAATPDDVALPSAGVPDLDEAATSRPVGPAALVGVEIEPPASGWPPALDRDLDDLGLVASGADRRRVAASLASAAHRPAMLAAVCDASATPDRGVSATIRALRAAAASPGVLILSGGERLRRRDSRSVVARRLEDWRELAAELGVAFVEIDFDHLTAESRRRLVAAIAPDAAAEPASPSLASAGGATLSEALRAIVAAARCWSDASGVVRPPTAAEEADLHRRIVRLFEGDGEIARWPFPPLSPADPAGSIRRAASRIESMLPASLRMRPKWLAAGAAAGALGCVAAATLVSPLAISALPVWSGIGGGIAGLLSARAAGDGAESTKTSSTLDYGPPVATAVLQAVLLAHQGRGEAAIGAALENAIGPDDPPQLADAEAVAAWIRIVEARLVATRRGDEA